MIIRGAEGSKRRARRAYFGWRSESYMNLAPQLHRCRPCSSTQRNNALEHQHSHRYYHKRDQSVTLPSADYLPLAGAAAVCPLHDVGNEECAAAAHRSTSFPSDESLTVAYISQRNPRLRSRSPVAGTQSLLVHDRHGAAMAARNRLDERFRAASLINRRSRSNSFQGDESPLTNVLLDEDERSIRKENIVVEFSMTNGLATRVPSFEGAHSGYDSQPLKSNEALREAAIKGLQKETAIRGRKRAGKKFGKSKRESSEQEDCPVCLEQFSLDQVLIRLPCNHRFHYDCLTPWLESHSHCPYCRAKVSDKAKLKASPLPGSANQNVIQPRNNLVWCITTIETLFRKLGLQATS